MLRIKEFGNKVYDKCYLWTRDRGKRNEKKYVLSIAGNTLFTYNAILKNIIYSFLASGNNLIVFFPLSN